MSSALATAALVVGLTYPQGGSVGDPAQHLGADLGGWRFEAVQHGAVARRGNEPARGFWALSLQRRWTWPREGPVRILGAFGAWHALRPPRGRTIGCRTAYRTTAGFQVGPLEAAWHHTSTAGICRPNSGLDYAGLTLRLPFRAGQQRRRAP